MQCTQCQHEFPEGAKFCPECGQRVADAPAVSPAAIEIPAPIKAVVEAAEPEAAMAPITYAPPVEPPVEIHDIQREAVVAPSPPPVVAPQRIVEPSPPAKKHKRHGCLISFGVFLVLVGTALALLFDLPTRLGLISSPAEKMFTEPVDAAAAEMLTQDFEKANQPTKGISFYVLPYKDRGYSLAYVVLDQSQGYRYVDTGFENPVFAAFQLVARSKAVEKAQVYRVAVEFREADGVTLSVLTAPVFAIQQYDAKAIDKKQFIAKVDGHANLARMYKDQYTWLGGPQ